MMTQMTPARAVECQIDRTQEAMNEERDAYARACRDLARNLVEYAGRAERGEYVSGSPMSSSLCQDITRHAQRHADLTEQLGALRFIAEALPQVRLPEFDLDVAKAEHDRIVEQINGESTHQFSAHSRRPWECRICRRPKEEHESKPSPKRGREEG